MQFTVQETFTRLVMPDFAGHGPATYWIISPVQYFAGDAHLNSGNQHDRDPDPGCSRNKQNILHRYADPHACTGIARKHLSSCIASVN